MPKLHYLSLMRLPTEKAHGLQIMQNCEAFAEAGCDVTLWVARRWNTREMRAIEDPYAFYGVERNFNIRRIPCIDLFPLFPADGAGARLAFYILQLTYAAAMLLCLLFTRAEIYYSRDEFLLVILGRLQLRRKIVYEAHLYPTSRRGASLQRIVCRRAGNVIAITPQLRDDLIAHRGAESVCCLAAHDGFQRARFSNLPERRVARLQIGWDEKAFIVGYVGSLQMIGLDKGVDTLMRAVSEFEHCQLALIGTKPGEANSLQRAWSELGAAESRLHCVGRIPPQRVPLYLAALDVCAMPHPPAPQFARYTSPLKLFEYMAAGRGIIASDLPGWSDVLVDGESALLVPPEDIAAWSAAIARLRADPLLRRRLGRNARERALSNYTWNARAEKILTHIGSA